MRKDLDCENVYEKWLRRRLNYTCIRATGRHCPAQLVHQMFHQGQTYEEVTSQLKYKLWTLYKYPNPAFFNHGMVLHRYPDEIKELLKLRFFDDTVLPNSSRCGQLVDVEIPFNLGVKSKFVTEDDCANPKVYRLSLPEVVEVPHWSNTSRRLPCCPYPHLHETPLSWTLDCDKEIETQPFQFPLCCYKEQECCDTHCPHPVPQIKHLPGPWTQKDSMFLWR